MADLQQNTWILDQWYAQAVVGNTGYVGERTIFSWGSNASGMLGLNEPGPSYKSSPTQVGSATDWKEFSYTGDGREWVSCLRTDYVPTSATLWGWGNNEQGQLGTSNTVDKSSPTQTYQGSEWEWNEVARGYGFQLGVLTNGTLYSWGYNAQGQLGLNQSTPTVKDDPDSGSNLGTGWAVGENKIAVASNCGYAIKTNGALWVWGNNSAGQLADDSTTNRSSPVQIPGTWSKIFAGGSNGAGIKSDGTMWIWGLNDEGQLGFNNKTNYSSPKQLPGTWTAAAMANARGTFLNTNGELWMCGHNTNGALGQNNNTQYSSPRQVPGTWSKITGSFGCSGAIKTDGSLWTWGSNQNGELGHNSQTHLSSPKQIPGNWHDITCPSAGVLGMREA